MTAVIKGHRVVLLGDRMYSSTRWRTFHDYLFEYIKHVMSPDWGNAELAKPYKERHPIIQWYGKLCDFQGRKKPGPGGIYSAHPEGVVAHYLQLAYDLYTLQYADLLQERLIARLKQRDNFQGALYEVSVAASCVRAGFQITLEDETDRTTSHCEFTICRATGADLYSVEAKSRHRPGVLGRPGEPVDLALVRADVRRLLQKALKKRATGKRIIFVDVNVPARDGGVLGVSWLDEVAVIVREMEERQVPSSPWPPAYLFFTNTPFHYLADEARAKGAAYVLSALNEPDFKIEAYATPKGQAVFQARHPDIVGLFHSLLQHGAIPHEFDLDTSD
ncbi:hypothetical protein [Sphingomonas hankyongi]|uniref:Uncharacterized protein n=1 Tax=Sphingomonas hankyongi TaxID=2908209 RepID=A0ABT0S2B2_9SPHN|nr:hypothetical protein [Sphingomonas hankyongi]MCL6729961.1 hypothetical protein [Sphingomonas hankyongi]